MNAIGIGEMARRSGVGRETIRFYERESLLPPPPRTASNYRRYPPQALDRLRFIRRAKELGFTLDEIRELLSLQDADGDRAAAKRLAAEKLKEIRARIRQLRRMESVLSALDAQCSGHGPAHACPILETLAGHTRVPDATPKIEGTRP